MSQLASERVERAAACGPRHVGHAIAAGLLVLGAAPAAHGQCQTWSLEPAFAPANVSGFATYAGHVFDAGSGPELWVGGSFQTSAGTSHVARWNGQQWIATPALDGSVHALATFDSGAGPELYAGGVFTHAGAPTIARWTGAAWAPVGQGLQHEVLSQVPIVAALTVYDPGTGPELYVAGTFGGAVGGPFSSALIRWDGSSFQAVGASGLSSSGSKNYPAVAALAVYDAGQGPELYVAGQFEVAGGTIARIARWNGTSWSSLGSGVNGSVQALAVWDDGGGAKLYAGGTLTNAGGVPVSKIAVWDGSTWSALPVAPTGVPLALFPFDDGRGPALFVAASAQAGGVATSLISRFDGTSWSALGAGLQGNGVYGLCAYDDGAGSGGDLYALGRFESAGAGVPSMRIARWTRCADAIEAVCPGDHTLAACPCGNAGAPGRGCANSAATGGAVLVASGTSSPDTLVLSSSGELASSLTILLQGSAPTASVLAFGDGLRCTGGNLLRLYVSNAVAGTATLPGVGDPSISARSSALGDTLASGAVRLYQAYYRDPQSVCGSFFNASNGVRVVW